MRKFSVEADKERVANLYRYERHARVKGYKLIAGVDEAGRGSLVGEVVIAAVILPDELYLARLDDSKKLSAKVRDALFEQIKAKAVSYSCVSVSIEVIDTLNIYKATMEGMRRAVAALSVQPDFVLTDAMRIDFDGTASHSIVHGDALSASIAAASIIAKVTRDRLAEEWALTYPQYGFERNRGYGTKEHMEAIKNFGACPLHRRTFDPVKSLLRK